jgi:nuclear pore complex protein Nup54
VLNTRYTRLLWRSTTSDGVWLWYVLCTRFSEWSNIVPGSAQASQGTGFIGAPSQAHQTSGTTGSVWANTERQKPLLSQQQSNGMSLNTMQQSQQQPSAGLGGLGQSMANQQQQPLLQLGQGSLAPSRGTPSIWEEGRGLGGSIFSTTEIPCYSLTCMAVYRTIPAQMMLIKFKWDPNSLSCPLRTYLYQVVDEQNASFYQPGPGEDDNKWEEAVSKRPGPNYVPALARGFWDLGKRAQRQREFIEKINIRLHDINQSMDAQIEIHSQQIASRLAECRRKHLVASQRTLALAAKVQLLRHRGYVMDTSEEELRSSLSKLEREIFDPGLTSREQEIWAKLLSIRERSKTLQKEYGRTASSAQGETSSFDESAAQAAKRVSSQLPKPALRLTRDV